MIGSNKSLSEQIDILYEILKKNEEIFNIIEKSEELGLSEYYIGAGCITQTVWNYQNNNPLLFGINDIDFVYFDRDLSIQKEDIIIKKINEKFKDSKIKLDIKNQGRVHKWYKKHFGFEITPYNSVEESINTWPTTSNAVGVKISNGKLEVYAPYGLNDMFSQIIRPNKLQITEEIYNNKVNKWLENWPELKIIPW